MSTVERLAEALEWREQFEPRDGEDSNERFERIAEVFRKETGYLRPGKDCRLHSPEERQAAWDAWMAAGRELCRLALAAYRSTPADGGGQGVTPLTDDERRKLWRESHFRGNGGQIDWFIEGTKAAERWHRIGTPASTGGEDRG